MLGVIPYCVSILASCVVHVGLFSTVHASLGSMCVGQFFKWITAQTLVGMFPSIVWICLKSPCQL